MCQGKQDAPIWKDTECLRDEWLTRKPSSMDPGKAAMEEWTNLVWGPHRTERCGVQDLLSLSDLSSMKGTREIRCSCEGHRIPFPDMGNQ